MSFIKLAKNTGMPYLPRNVAVNFSRGKYLAFLDNDDFFTKTALEELTTLAEEHQADVINMRNVFSLRDDDSNLREKLALLNQQIEASKKSQSYAAQKILDVPADIAGRVQLWLNNGFQWATWNSFCRRDFWVSNQIIFPRMPVSDDTLANFACLCFAKKIISVPNVCYIHRIRAGSISQEVPDVGKFFHRWVNNLVSSFKNFDAIMERVPFFAEHPDYRYAVLDWFFNRNIEDARIFPVAYSQIHTAILNQFVEKEFSGDDAGFSAYLFNTVNIQKLRIMQLQQENSELKKNLS